jgi:heme exporter protein D
VTFIFNVVAGVVVTVDWNRRVLQEVINVRQRSSSNDLLYASNEG